jgi:hypothetical protein
VRALSGAQFLLQHMLAPDAFSKAGGGGWMSTLCEHLMDQHAIQALMEFAMINWPEMPRQAEDWATGFWVGTTTASLVGIILAAAALLSHVI